MAEREEIIRLWFEMWMQQKDLGIDNIFTEDVIYTESWGPRYTDRRAVRHWFYEWNSRGMVLAWNIRQFLHAGNQTVVEWYFKSQMKGSDPDEFDGMSLIEWTSDNRIQSLKEFGCNLNNYDPYANGETPEFRDEPVGWF